MKLYQILGVRRNATTETIRRAYMKAVKKAHPDAGGDRETFMALQEAWEILRDPERRRRYDDTGDTSQMTDEELSAHRALGSIINTIMQNIVASGPENLDYIDLRHDVVENIKQKRFQMEQDRVGVSKLIRRNRQLKKKFKFMGDGTDYIAGALDSQHVSLLAQSESIVKAIELNEKVVAVFLGYVYETDPPWGEGQISPERAGPSRRLMFPADQTPLTD